MQQLISLFLLLGPACSGPGRDAPVDADTAGTVESGDAAHHSGTTPRDSSDTGFPLPRVAIEQLICGNGDARLGSALAVSSASGLAAIGAPSTHAMDDNTWAAAHVVVAPFAVPETPTTTIKGGGFSEWLAPYNYLGSEVLLPGDVTGDGVEDLVVFDRAAASAYWPLGAGAFLIEGPLADRDVLRVESDSRPLSGTAPWRGAPCGDVNSDGVADLCLATGVEFGPVATDSPLDVTWNGVEPLQDVRLGRGDLDGDGRNEVLLWDPGRHVLLRITAFAAGAYDPRTIAAAEWTAESGDIVTSVKSGGDLDGDGQQDVALIWSDHESSRVIVVTSRHGGTLAAPFASLNVNASALAIGDLDGDGQADLAVGGDASVWVFRGPLSQGELSLSDAAVWWVGWQSYTDEFGAALEVANGDLWVGAPGNVDTVNPGGCVYLLPRGGL